MKDTHHQVYQPANIFISEMQFERSQDGSTISMMYQGTKDQMFVIAYWQAVAKHSMTSLNKCLGKLLRYAASDLNGACIPVACLQDNITKLDSFQTNDTLRECLGTLTASLADYVTNTHLKKQDSEEDFVRPFLEADQEFLHVLSVVFMLTCGNPPHGFQLISLCYQGMGAAAARNFYIMAGMPVFCYGS